MCLVLRLYDGPIRTTLICHTHPPEVTNLLIFRAHQLPVCSVLVAVADTLCRGDVS
jgi:hypothetical protein